MVSEASNEGDLHTSYHNIILCLVARFARERVQPLVSKMDQESQMEPSLISDMFEQGVSVIYCRCMTKCVCV